MVNEGSDYPFAFEIENAYIGPRTIARLLVKTDGVVDVRLRRPFTKWEDIHVWFKYTDREFIVFEPYGDSSRYLIGPGNPDDKAVDIRPIQDVFRRYRPPLLRRMLGDVLTLRLFKRLIGRA